MFKEKLIEFLESEVNDYDLEYCIEIGEEENEANVTITRFDNVTVVEFRFKDGDLQIDMAENSWETVREFDWTVKYFWMLISPVVFR